MPVFRVLQRTPLSVQFPRKSLEKARVQGLLGERQPLQYKSHELVLPQVQLRVVRHWRRVVKGRLRRPRRRPQLLPP